jgi:probable rRNA maturation factor
VDSSIRFFSEEINFTLKKKSLARTWLANVIREESHLFRDINIIFCSDEYLLQLNIRYLNHKTFTDILTFPNQSDPKKISGDIYISIDRIKENAKKYGQPFEKELARVMVHGTLHLLGYKDKTPKDKEMMTRKENYYLDRLFSS